MPQVVLTLPLLEGTDGVLKMSKTFDNYIGINEQPKSMFGKLMSISDELMLKYYTLLTDENIDSIKQLHPKEAKSNLAELISARYHGDAKAKSARDEFESVFSQKELPKEIPEYKLKNQSLDIVDVLLESGLVSSKNEARRLIKQEAVTLNDSKIKIEGTKINQAGIIKVGRRRFLKIVP